MLLMKIIEAEKLARVNMTQSGEQKVKSVFRLFLVYLQRYDNHKQLLVFISKYVLDKVPSSADEDDRYK